MLAGADFNLNANLRNTPTVLEHTLSMPTATRMLEVYLARLMNHLVPGSPPPPPPPPRISAGVWRARLPPDPNGQDRGCGARLGTGLLGRDQGAPCSPVATSVATPVAKSVTTSVTTSGPRPRRLGRTSTAAMSRHAAATTTRCSSTDGRPAVRCAAWRR